VELPIKPHGGAQKYEPRQDESRQFLGPQEREIGSVSQYDLHEHRCDHRHAEEHNQHLDNAENRPQGAVERFEDHRLTFWEGDNTNAAGTVAVSSEAPSGASSSMRRATPLTPVAANQASTATSSSSSSVR
jgi:hypothetical protein